MQSVIFKIHAATRYRRLDTKWSRALAAILVLVSLGCTSHGNPFDPENKKTRGEPFNLASRPGFGQIILKWNLLPSTLKVERYDVYRKQSNSPWAKVTSTQVDSFPDDSVASETKYSYQVNAWRGNEGSDSSEVVEAQANWYPKQLNKLGDYDDFPNPVDLAFCPSHNRRYFVCEDRDFIVVLDQFDQKVAEDAILVGSSPKAIAHWHNDRTNLDTLLVGNYGSSSLSVIAEESANRFKVIQTFRLEGRPLSIQISNALQVAFISFEARAWIRKFKLKRALGDTLAVTGRLRRLFLVGESGPLLGINRDEDKVAIIDVISGAVKYSETVEDMPYDLAIVPGSNLAYLACHYAFGYRNAVRISVINFATGARVPEREIVIPADPGKENHPTSVAIVPGGLDDGLLFVAVRSISLGQQAARIFGYHIGPAIKNRIAVQEIPEVIPQLIRRPPNLAEKKLYVLHTRGLHIDF